MDIEVHRWHQLESLVSHIKATDYLAVSQLSQQDTAAVKHDKLLSQCLTIIDIFTETAIQNSRHAEYQSEEMERLITTHSQQKQELQLCLQHEINKNSELTEAIMNRNDQIDSLRTLIDQKSEEVEIQGVEREREMKDARNYIECSIKNKYEEEIQLLKRDYERVLQENQILAERLDEALKYIEQMAQNGNYIEADEQSLNNSSDGHQQIQEETNSIVFQQVQNIRSPRCLRKVYETSPMLIEKQNSKGKVESYYNTFYENCSGQGPNKENQNSLQKLSIQSFRGRPEILRQILNTEERSSGAHIVGNFHSKERMYLKMMAEENIREQEGEGEVQENKKKNYRVIQEFKTSEEQLNTQIDPYQAFFTLTVQSVKINSGNLEAASLIDLSGHWDRFVKERVPFHRWYSELAENLTNILTVQIKQDQLTNHQQSQKGQKIRSQRPDKPKDLRKVSKIAS